MWLFQPQRLCILGGILIFILVILTEHADAGGMVRAPRKNPREKNLKMKPGKKSRDRNSKGSSKKKGKKSGKKNTALSNTKKNVNTCPAGSEELQMNCLSCATKVYRECPVAAATKITKVAVVSEFDDSYERCESGRSDNYGIKDKNAIWVDRGCRARFLICYEKGQHEPKNVNCMCTNSRHECPVGLPTVNIHIQVSILWSFGSGKCKQGETWGNDDNKIWVDRGCSATFRVLW